MPLWSFVVFSALISSASAALTRRAPCPDGVHTATNPACCPLFPIVDSIQDNLFNRECGDEVHESLRLTFHDAIPFSHSQGPSGGGGADGSIMTFADTETKFSANEGLDDIIELQRHCFMTNGGHDVISPGDFIQLAAAVGIGNCPGAPRLEFLAGRPVATAAAPDSMVPSPTQSTDTILARFSDAGFNSDEVVALLASHSIAASKVIDPSIAGSPFDTTPGVFDSQVFVEVLLRPRGFHGNQTDRGEVDSPLQGEIRIKSDHDFARDPRTACKWQSYANNQAQMAEDFRKAMAKLAVLGQNTSQLVDCSEVIPDPIPLPEENSQSVFPAGFSNADVEQACAGTPFPRLATDPDVVAPNPSVHGTS